MTQKEKLDIIEQRLICQEDGHEIEITSSYKSSMGPSYSNVFYKCTRCKRSWSMSGKLAHKYATLHRKVLFEISK
jgi:hypothetical protein